MRKAEATAHPGSLVRETGLGGAAEHKPLDQDRLYRLLYCSSYQSVTHNEDRDIDENLAIEAARAFRSVQS